MKKNEYQLTNEEKEILASFDKGEWKRVKNIDAERQKYLKVAKDSLKKSKSISIRISENDLHKVKVKAVQEGVPYQTLISSIIHQYIHGRKFL